MAYIRKRLDSWEVSINKKGFPRRSLTFSTKADAEKWARHIEAEMDRSVFVSRKESENTTLEEALDRYERKVIPSKKGARQESMRMRIWKRSSLAKRSIASIQGMDIAAYRDARLKEVAPNTVRHELALLSHVFTIAVKEWGMGGLVNPVKQIRAPKMPPGRDRRLKPGELDRILGITESPTLPNLARFAIETAVRQEEIAEMTWEHVSLEKKTAKLKEKQIKHKETIYRTIPLFPLALKILTNLPRRIDGKVWGITPHAISVAWRRAVARARAPYEKECTEKGTKLDPTFLVDLTFHDLRHEATSRLNTAEVSAVTGQKTLQMLKRYTHLRAEDLAEKWK